MIKLNIGCGRDYKKEWENWDISNEVKAERHLDITLHKWPTDDNSVIEIYISGVLEQIAANKDLIHVMNECHRVLTPGGKMVVVVPNARFAIAHRDPMDIRKFTRETFSYFQKGLREHDLYGSVYGFKGWSKIRIGENERHIFTIDMIK